MSKVIMVPVHLDGFFLSRERLVTESFADFSRLPFRGSEEDYNPDTANISESILSQPFQNTNLNLKKGMHLHWSLPDALTKGGAGGAAEDYPAVPNRWLIRRSSATLSDKSWVVESDYLHQGLENPYGSIAYPVDTNNPSEQPFRYLGRQLEATGWIEDPGAERLSKLTAIGYGEPAFAAFYPNCHSVFGCFDPDVDTESQLQGLSYRLIGWYSNTAQDPLVEFLDDFLTDNPGADQAALEQAVKEQFSWNVSIDTNDMPGGMLCYANLTFSPNASIDNPRKDQPATISIGNTGTEALSAHLAAQLNPANAIQLEEQLEQLLLQTQLQVTDLDLGPRFKEARHEKGFIATKGGSLWEIKPANEDNTATSVSIGLPPAMSDTLDELNGLQQQADQAAEAFIRQKQILFADWYKYMLCAYPPDDSRDDYPDIDYVKWYIENQGLSQVQTAAAGLSYKQFVLAAPKAALEGQIDNFNSSTISKNLLFRPLTADTADTSLLSLTGTTWQDNNPFSGQCLYFNGSDASLSISGTDGIKALSLWVSLAAQNADDATLLSTASAGALMSKNTTAGFWDKIAINGVIQPVYQSFQWSSLPKDRWFHLYIEFTEALTGDTLYLFSNANTQFLSGKLAGVRLFDDALSSDELYYDQNMLGHERYQLKEVAAPRFWQPTEPVVLIAGDSVEPTTRHGQDGRLNEDNTLDCPDTEVSNYPLQETDFSGLLSEISTGAPIPGAEKIGYEFWSEEPWHPFLLEWEVEVFPMSAGGNLDIDSRGFNPGFITTNYTLEENSPELSVQDGKSVISAAAIYSGRTVLTPYAKEQLTKTITGQLNNLRQEDSYQVIGTFADTGAETTYNTALTSWYAGKPAIADWYATDVEYDSAIAAYSTWYEGKPVYNGGIVSFDTLSDTEQLQDFNYALIKAYEEALDAHFISQGLSGFNNALLMQHQTLQLPVADPLGFQDYRTFTNQVRAAIGDNTNLAPLPLNDFLPLRSGAMRLLNLRIIDSFGQSKTLETTNPLKAEPLALPATVVITDPVDVWLPPRFVQPVRLNFRWLSAGTGSQELNTHPQSSPVCGWLLANHLDNSLAVYDQQGNALGIIDQQAKWRNVPGTDATIDPSDFDNAYLQKVIERLALIYDEQDPGDTKKTFLEDFISVTDKALENIDPESFVHHRELALLMGRPIAVVRASLNLELKGSAAIHHGWTEFGRDLLRQQRETDGFENVMIPIRVGERGQLNDGVLGYWKEDTDNALETVFYTTVAQGEVSNSAIQSYEQAPLDLMQSLDSNAQTLTMLVDPRGDIHATTGMLPVKSINIPKSDYTDALKKINITFLSAPVLSAADQVALPLPNELGYRWSWLAKDRFSWRETANTGILRKDTLLSAFSNGEAIWTQLLDKGWISGIDTNRAGIVSTDQRTTAQLDAPFDAQADKIQALLDAGHIIPVNTKAIFNNDQTIKEGWLKLSPLDN